MNPGNFKKRKPHTIKKFIRKLYGFFINDQWKSFFFYFITEIINNLSFYNINTLSNLKICPICNYNSSSFHHLSNHSSITWNSACPRCDSRSRHRGLYLLYNYYFKNIKSKKILHFAPEKILYIVSQMGMNTHYSTTDLNMNNMDYPREDIQNLSFKDSSFDITLCNHVLEHVKNDAKALKELSRITKKNGFSIITIPIDWKSKKTIIQNPKYHNGHFRHYGFDVVPLMEKFFENITIINLSKLSHEDNAIKKTEIAFICKK